MRQRISKRTIDALRPGKSIADLELRGFGARRLPSGAITYDLRYRTKSGHRRRISLGMHGAITPDQARTKAEKHLDQLGDDKDPAEEKQRERGTTVKAVWEEYAKRELSKLRSKDTQEKTFKRLVEPAIGERSIYDLRRSDMAALLDSIDDNCGPVMADRTLAYIRAAFNWQQTRDDDFVSPIVIGMARTKPKDRKRARKLDDNELRAIWKATEGAGTFKALVRFLLFTAARRDEAASMEKSEIKGIDWTLPAKRNKVNLDLVRPLSKAAREVLAALPKNDECKFVFTTDGKTSLSGYSGFKEALDKESGVTGWTLHDLRRTARTLMSRAKVNADHAEQCLGHVIGGVRETYDRYEYYDEKRVAYDKLAALIAKIVKRKSASAS